MVERNLAKVEVASSSLVSRSTTVQAVPCDAGIAQLVERNLAKVEVASSSLVSRSITVQAVPCDAGIAQLVERNLAKVEVASSSLVSRSTIYQSDSALTEHKLRRGSKAVMHRIANPCRSVRLRPAPPNQTLPRKVVNAQHSLGVCYFPFPIARHQCITTLALFAWLACSVRFRWQNLAWQIKPVWHRGCQAFRTNIIASAPS